MKENDDNLISLFNKKEKTVQSSSFTREDAVAIMNDASSQRNLANTKQLVTANVIHVISSDASKGFNQSAIGVPIAAEAMLEDIIKEMGFDYTKRDTYFQVVVNGQNETVHEVVFKVRW